jgi:predicted glycosyltransferase
MNVWIDLANSPHVATFEPVVEQLRADGATVVLTARDHAQTVDLARRTFGHVLVVGDESPARRAAKGMSILRRARALRSIARSERPDVALSHGSYSQLLAARVSKVPGVTMMDYEYQPANHLSFRLARRVIVPELFPARALRRAGARPRKVVRYPGFKEELYLGRFVPTDDVLRELNLDPARLIAVLRPPPQGALYHRGGNDHFEALLLEAATRDDLQVVVLPRVREQAARYIGRTGVIVPERPVDGLSLLAHADVMIGAGGTMNREAALLGTPTYTMFAGKLAAVDAELIDRGLLHDLRTTATIPPLAKKATRDVADARVRSDQILDVVLNTVAAVARHGSPRPHR